MERPHIADPSMLDPEDVDKAGPLAELDRLCTLMQDHLDPMRRWYPDIVAALHRLDSTIRWEQDRLAWEIAFLARVRAERASPPARRRRTVKAVAAEVAR